MNYAQTVIKAFGLEKTEGDVALELEVEGRDLPSIRSKMWNTHTDGSLKLGGMEYVHNGPKPIDEVLESLKNFEDRVVKSKSIVYESERTSVHAHLNMQEKTVKQVIQAATAYYMLEPALMNIAGEKRKGNLFCLTMETAPAIVEFMKSLSDGTAIILNTDKYRYASLNFGALRKFGSLEVRTMRGYYDPEYLDLWSRGLRSLFDQAGEMKSPTEVLDSWYGKTKDEFLGQFFDGKFIDLLKSFKGWDERLDRNHKNLTFIYETDWSKEEKDFPEPKKAVNPDWSVAPPVRAAVPSYIEVGAFSRVQAIETLKGYVSDVLRNWYGRLPNEVRFTTDAFNAAIEEKFPDTVVGVSTRGIHAIKSARGNWVTFSNARYDLAEYLERSLDLQRLNNELITNQNNAANNRVTGLGTGINNFVVDDLFFGDQEE